MIALIMGTRPEIIKFAPIIWELQRREIPFEIIHSGQHYSPNMYSDFFKELEIPTNCMYKGILEPGLDNTQQIGRMIERIGYDLDEGVVDIVAVLGDTNTALAGCISAARLKIPVAHIEAGLRCGERWMPEEQNRIMIDHNSDYLFPPTIEAYTNLIREGLNPKAVYGNTIKDVVAVTSAMGDAHWSTEGITQKQFALVTIHRQENTDNIKRLKTIISELRKISVQKDIDIIFPIHPRTKKALDKNNINYSFIRELPPLPLNEMLNLEAAADFIITDSGGVQEEACILMVPCITVRPSTERPETIRIGANRLVEPHNLSKAARGIAQDHFWIDPYGDYSIGTKIVDELCRKEK